jgi:hypothetical protein
MASAAPPAAFKSIAPFLARAKECKTADPVLAYWCASDGRASGRSDC